MQRDEDTFKLWLAEVGSSKSSRGYGMWEDKSALRLAFSAVRRIAEAFAGRHKAQFKYDLACLLLSEIEGEGISRDRIWEKRQQFRDEAEEEGGLDALDDWWAVEEDAEENGGDA